MQKGDASIMAEQAKKTCRCSDGRKNLGRNKCRCGHRGTQGGKKNKKGLLYQSGREKGSKEVGWEGRAALAGGSTRRSAKASGTAFERRKALSKNGVPKGLLVSWRRDENGHRSKDGGTQTLRLNGGAVVSGVWIKRPEKNSHQSEKQKTEKKHNPHSGPIGRISRLKSPRASREKNTVPGRDGGGA